MLAPGRMPRHLTVRELEQATARTRSPRARPRPTGEAVAMLVRRGFRPVASAPDLPFPPALDGPDADALADLLGHYGFRLFLRGAIQRSTGFAPGETTRYLESARALGFAESLVGLRLAERRPRGRFRLLHPARSFGGTLEWYVARELERRYGFEVAVGLKLGAPGVGGDLDVVAGAEGKLVYLELKSSPPKHLSEREVAAFFDRLAVLGPDLAVFAVDTALRLSDKIVPMLEAELRQRRPGVSPVRRVERELWALTPHLYAVNAKPDLLGNLGRAIACGLRALAPPQP